MADKLDLIYDIVKETKDKICDMEKRIISLEEFKNRLIGISITVGCILSASFEFIKSFFIHKS